jgi:hypothetical protein
MAKNVTLGHIGPVCDCNHIRVRHLQRIVKACKAELCCLSLLFCLKFSDALHR